ncbi:metal-dependent hydrolase [Methanobacterium oryzae]|uniref:metal-dependent hydrolase n=1 Tax=Methanobacterium oryzae TaxID=69540 RepID=UPI003D24A8F6
MPSYKKHALFALIIALPFFQDAFYLSLAVIGASIIDMDHHVKKNNLIIMAVFGILISLILYILQIPFLIGISLIGMVLIFHLSKHRGFSHSLCGAFVLSFLLSFFVLGFYNLFNGFNIDSRILTITISFILGIIVLNKKILLPFIILTSLGIIIAPTSNLSFYYTFLAILAGSLSHMLLDLFTPRGIELLNPLSSRKFKKGFGSVLFILWAFSAFIFIFGYGNIII